MGKVTKDRHSPGAPQGKSVGRGSQHSQGARRDDHLIAGTECQQTAEKHPLGESKYLTALAIAGIFIL
jgi:hypothetical protein